jgi:hypothetical protein
MTKEQISQGGRNDDKSNQNNMSDDEKRKLREKEGNANTKSQTDNNQRNK